MTGKEVATSGGGALTVSAGQTAWSPAQTAALRQLGLEEATEADLDVFLHVAQRSGLDPFARQIHMIGRRQKIWDPQARQEQWITKYTIQTGIDGFRLIADRSGKYAGQVGPQWCGPDGAWRDVWLGSKPPAAARVGVLRRDFTEPIYAVAVFREYAQTKKNGDLNSMWGSKGSIMIAKCAEALALRKAFPQDLSGLYTPEEMAQVDQQVTAGAPSPRRPVESRGETAPDGEQPSRVVDGEPVRDAPQAGSPRLPEDFALLVDNAEENRDLEALRDLHKVAEMANNRPAQASVIAAVRRFAPDALKDGAS